MTRTYDELLAIADAAESVVDGTPSSDAAASSTSGTEIDDQAVNEADDDPHRLARVNLDRYQTRTDGRTLAYWREEWYAWKRNAYRRISDKELRAKLSATIKTEFDRIAREKQTAMAESTRDNNKDEAVTQKVTMALISNIMQATSGMVCVSGDTEPNTWLPDKSRPNWISMANGLVDVDAILGDRDDYIQPNTPRWFSMVSLPYTFDPEADCPTWRRVLHSNQEEDFERINLLQEWTGYLLTASTDEQKFMILEGEGKNGKSVFLAGVTAMLGLDNVSNVALENFGDRFQITNTIGKLLNACGDCGELDRTSEGLLKSFVAGDRMYFDRKGLSGYNATPTARLMIACNNLPRLSDRSDGIWRRLLCVPWRIEIDEATRVKGMDKPAWWERSGELPGIFRWALQGLARLQRQGGFTSSLVAQETLQDHKEEMNPARGFLQEYVEEASTGAIKSSELFRLYKKWTDENGYRPLAEKSFGKEVRRVFKKVKRIKSGSRVERFWSYEGVQFSVDEVCGEKTGESTLF